MPGLWKYQYGENSISVNSALAGSELRVNGQLQDRKNGFSLSTELSGKLPDGKEIKASVGGIMTVQCSLFVEHVLQKPIEVK